MITGLVWQHSAECPTLNDVMPANYLDNLCNCSPTGHALIIERRPPVDSAEKREGDTT